MIAGYVRQDVSNQISNGNIIDADVLDSEYNAIQAAFNSSTGHKHDGTSGEGAPITKLGPTQDVVASGTNFNPKTTATIDMGTGSLKFKDAYFSGSVSLGSVVATSNFQGLATDSATAPSFTWAGDANTGIWHPAADTFAITTAGTERLRITSGGAITVGGSITATGGFTGNITGNVTGNVTGNITGSVTGNAATATALATARNFSITGGATAAAVSFNGSSSVTLTVTALNASQLSAGTVADARLPTTMAGKTFTSGIDFGSSTSSAPDDLSRHIALHGSTYGFSVTGASLNLVVRPNAKVSFVIGGVECGLVNETGFSGSGSQLTSLPAAELTGTIASARISGAYTGFSNITGSGTATFDIFAASAASGFRGFTTDTVSTPSFTWGGDTNTGMYRSASNTIGFASGGVVKMTVGANITAGSGVAFIGEHSGDGSALTALNATQITTGTLDAARLSTTTVARDWVLDRISEASAGALGTYAFLRHINKTINLTTGSTVSGSSLSYTNAGSGAVGGSPSGTWRCMGRIISSSEDNANTTLFLRIA